MTIKNWDETVSPNSLTLSRSHTYTTYIFSYFHSRSPYSFHEMQDRSKILTFSVCILVCIYYVHGRYLTSDYKDLLAHPQIDRLWYICGTFKYVRNWENRSNWLCNLYCIYTVNFCLKKCNFFVCKSLKICRSIISHAVLLVEMINNFRWKRHW